MSSREQTVEQQIAVGLAVFVDARNEGKEGPQFATAVRGWKQREYILLDVVSDDIHPIDVGRFIPCEIRFVSKGQLFSFKSRITGISEQGTPYLKLTWPKELKSINVRQDERVPTKIQCRICDEDQTEVEGEISDLSAGGCCIRSSFKVPVGETIRLTFDLPDATHLESVKASVRNMRKTEGGYDLGCMFDEAEEYARMRCHFYISMTLNRMRSQRLPSNTALVLESEQHRATLITHQLEEKGFEVLVVAGLVEAFFSLRMAPPGSLWISSEQEDISPLEICRIVRKAAGFEGLPIYIYGGEREDIEPRLPGVEYYCWIPS